MSLLLSLGHDGLKDKSRFSCVWDLDVIALLTIIAW